VNLAKAFANWPKWNFLGEQIVSEKELSFIIQGVNIIARADRMDLSSNGEVFFTDYKSSTASILKPKSWLQEAHFQILAYIHLSEHLGLKPIGGAYYNLNQFQFGPGYLIEESAQAELAKDFGLNAISSEVQSQMLADLHDQVLQAIDEISRGSLQALPLHEKHCRNCDWYSVCRSPFRETRREA
jgi:RecB family exonuclease